MCCGLLLIVGFLLLLFLCSLGYAEAEAEAESPIVYAPDVVAYDGIERLFMIVLKLPVETPEVKVTFPDCVTLVDQTPLSAKTEIRKYYFRTKKPAKKTTLSKKGTKRSVAKSALAEKPIS